MSLLQLWTKHSSFVQGKTAETYLFPLQPSSILGVTQVKTC